MKNLRVCIHIGLSKTATSTLQNQFFSNHSEIEYLGKYNLEQLQSNTIFYNEYATNLFKQIQEKDINNNRATALKQIFNKKILPELDSNKLLVVSSEGLATGSLPNRIRRANNFNALFGTCKIMIMLREPLDLIESLYFQKLKEYNLRDHKLWQRCPNCFSIEQWLKTHWQTSLSGPLWHLDYYQTIDAYTKIFGKENIGIFLFEQLKENPSAFLDNICKFVGIDAQHNLDIFNNSQHNQRWNEDNMDRLKAIQSSFIRSLKYRFTSYTQKKNALGQDEINRIGSNNKATTKIPNSWKMRIQEYTRPGNRIIMNKWRLPLNKYNYPI